jgi:hypothetical protein
MNDARILRDRQAIATRELDCATGSLPPVAGQSILAVTYQYLAYPNVPNVFYAVHLTEVDGTETEGGAATYVQPTALRVWPIYALNLGTAVPPQGTEVICSYVGGRLCFRFDG